MEHNAIYYPKYNQVMIWTSRNTTVYLDCRSLKQASDMVALKEWEAYNHGLEVQ
jgi:hypothetical protein